MLGELRYPRVNRRTHAIGYGVGEHGPDAPAYIPISLRTGRLLPDNRHWTFRAPGRAAICALLAVAPAHGGTDVGPPPNDHPDTAFVRDPDGNRIEAVTYRRED
ncbi:MAG: hypothetical protein JSR91_24690 [Proteobacteria bacterium]|nr:hypothetical protein [Pseudomonadota bacterium]